MSLLIGILIPFIGTMLGSSCVFFMKNNMSEKLEKILLGFASGVMIAASIWSLLIPSLEMTKKEILPWLKTTIGFIIGIFFLLIVNQILQRLNTKKNYNNKVKKLTMLILAVTLHNIPEGMAVGVILRGAISKTSCVTISGAIALSIGIAVQNIPEGMVISLPLRAEKKTKINAFIKGTLSGLVEPVGSIITLLLTNLVVNILPYMLSFAAGAMIYVVVVELIPSSQAGKNSYIATISLTIGFIIMMILDVSLG